MNNNNRFAVNWFVKKPTRRPDGSPHTSLPLSFLLSLSVFFPPQKFHSLLPSHTFLLPFPPFLLLLLLLLLHLIPFSFYPARPIPSSTSSSSKPPDSSSSSSFCFRLRRISNPSDLQWEEDNPRFQLQRERVKWRGREEKGFRREPRYQSINPELGWVESVENSGKAEIFRLIPFKPRKPFSPFLLYVMHQKKSEVQIGKESSGVSSDFNPTPPLLFPPPPPPSSSSVTTATSDHHHRPSAAVSFPPAQILVDFHDQVSNDPIAPSPSSASSASAPYKRTLLTHQQHHHHHHHHHPAVVGPPPPPPPLPRRSSSLSKSPTIYHFSPSSSPSHHHHHHPLLTLSIAAKSTALRFLRRFRHIRRVRVHLRLILLLSLPFFYFLVSHPSHSFFLDFFSAFAFSSVLLFSLNLALPRLPSIRLFLARSFPIKLAATSKISKPPLPVFWSIGSRTRSEKRGNSGCWVQVYSNGDVYEGEFHKGKCSGSGVYYYYMSGRYEGDWVDGKYDGYGVETWARGSRYRGQYRQGLRHGFGVYRFYTGDVYAGEWSNGQSHGCGVHTCEDGSRYVGEFKWGVKHGLGHYHFRNGDTYSGEYFADKMHGFGVYRFANGHRYEGAWHEGRRQGLGMYTFRNGETQSGHWQNGILDVPSTQNTTPPVSPVAVYHSKVLNAVQEARRAAERAYDVGKVDERVNRGVTAANRAANAARVAAVKAVQKQMHHPNHLENTLPIPIV